MSQLKNINMAVAQFNEAVPSTGEKIKITPFKVGDEKVLLMASESKDPKQMANALKQVVDNCSVGVTKPLSFFDYEYLFIKLRTISVGESTEVGVECQHCKHQNKVKIDMTQAAVVKDPNHTRVVKVRSDLGFEMKYPDVEKIIEHDLQSIDGVLDLVADCVTKVYYGEESIDIGLAEIQDLRDMLNGMTSNQLKDFKTFFQTMPKLKQNIEFNCSSCAKPNKHTLEGMRSFF